MCRSDQADAAEPLLPLSGCSGERLTQGLASPRISLHPQPTLPLQPSAKTASFTSSCQKGKKEILGLHFPLPCLHDLAGTGDLQALFQGNAGENKGITRRRIPAPLVSPGDAVQGVGTCRKLSSAALALPYESCVWGLMRDPLEEPKLCPLR